VAVPASEPAARLVGVEAMVAFTTARHSEHPLVVQGAGVGAASTAGTIVADVFRGTFAGAR
jgi:homoserine dehydrogenase